MARWVEAASRPGVVVLVCALALAGWCFRGVLFGGELFAFRDAGHYYPPLYRYVCEQWSAGQVPLWNPYENLGQPLAADPTAAVFYPGKLIFALLPGWDWAWRVYVLGHLGLALWGAYVLARRLGAGVAAAGAGAICYAFSGSVLFQCCNVASLVGAAWLPLALWAVDRMYWDPWPLAPVWHSSEIKVQGTQRTTGGWSWQSPLAPALWLAAALSMMILGGDPQMAYHAVLVAVLYLVFLPRGVAAVRPAGEVQTPLEGTAAAPLRTLAGRALSLFGAVALAGLLAAVQILPSMELSRLSARQPGTWAERLLARSKPDTHTQHIYDFSVAPWRLAELVWSNAGGRQLPLHRRWFAAIPAEGRVWAPSLYFGVVPLALAWGALRWRRAGAAPEEPGRRMAEARRRWLSWTALLALVASLGWYGPGWIVHELRVACGADVNDWLVGAPAGGLYWLMALVLPGYARFRYPAKLFVVAGLGLSMLAALGWDRMVPGMCQLTRRRLKRIAVISLLLAAGALALRPFWHNWLSAVEPDPLFGPLDAAGAWEDLFRAFVRAALVCAVFWRVASWRAKRPGPQTGKTDPLGAVARLQSGALQVGGGESRFASSGVSHVGGGALRLASGEVSQVSGAESRLASGEESRVGNAGGSWLGSVGLVVLAADLAMANGWLVAGAPAGLWHEKPRLGQLLAEHSASNGGANHELLTVWRQPIFLPERWREIGSAQRLAEEVAWDRDTLFPKYHLECRLRVLGVYGAFELEKTAQFLRSGAARDLASYLILPGDRAVRGGERLPTDVPDCSLWFNARHLPRAWIAHPRELSRHALPQWAPGADPPGTCAPQPLPGEWCRVVDDAAGRVELEARLAEAGLVVLADQYYPGWRVRVESHGRGAYEAQIVAVGGVLRGVRLGPGTHRLVYVYRPASVFLGAVLGGLGWLCAGGLGMVVCVRGRQR